MRWVQLCVLLVASLIAGNWAARAQIRQNGPNSEIQTEILKSFFVPYFRSVEEMPVEVKRLGER